MATKITVEWSGLQALIDDIRGLPKKVSEAVKEAQKEDLRDVASFLANYPPEKPGQHYRRTGNLGLGWIMAQPKIKNTGGLSFKASISNKVKYSGKVQGGREDTPRQERFFKERGWENVDDALAATETRAEKRINEAVQKALDEFRRKHRK